jgi:hypothetical protein
MMMMMDSLCLAENQFGFVALTGDGDALSIDNRGLVLSMDADMIDAYGYVTFAGGAKHTGCDFGAMSITRDVNDTEIDEAARIGSSDIAAWTILQDVGTGFFGTEIPTSTVTMTAPVADDVSTTEIDESMSAMLSCYGDDGDFNEDDDGNPQYRCGLIPERHNNTRVEGVRTPATATTASMVTARFDVIEGSENDVFVWLAEGQDGEDTAGSAARHVMATVTCEDGMVAQIPDESAFADAGAMMSMATVRLPNKVNMIDPMGDALMPFASQCMAAGGRGTLRFMMPDNSYAGMAWTHISQRMANFRMNMAGYNMADPEN